MPSGPDSWHQAPLRCPSNLQRMPDLAKHKLGDAPRSTDKDPLLTYCSAIAESSFHSKTSCSSGCGPWPPSTVLLDTFTLGDRDENDHRAPAVGSSCDLDRIGVAPPRIPCFFPAFHMASSPCELPPRRAATDRASGLHRQVPGPLSVLCCCIGGANSGDDDCSSDRPRVNDKNRNHAGHTAVAGARILQPAAVKSVPFLPALAARTI